MCAPDKLSKTTPEAKSSPLPLTIAVPVFAGLLFHVFPAAIESNVALDAWKYSHYTNTIASALTFLALLGDPPRFLKGSQAKRYAQLVGFGFLAVAIQSYHCASVVGPILNEAESMITYTAILFNVAFATLTWPMRIAENSPAINAAEKFFSALAVITSVGMVPALFLK